MRPDIRKNNQNGISTSTSAVSSRMKGKSHTKLTNLLFILEY
jgi:hypothetical protein